MSAMTQEIRELQASRVLSSTTQRWNRQRVRPDGPCVESGQLSKQNMTSEGIPSQQAAVARLVSEQPPQSQAPDSDGSDWAAAVASSPLVHSNRFATLMSTDDERSDGLVPEQQFTTVRPRRNKRVRNSTPTDSGSVEQQQPPQIQQRASLLVGKAASTGINSKLSAAQKIQKKCVFCIDNISTSCSVKEIESFVSSLPVKVESCFEVKPRRRREDGDDPIMNRKAFRLCVREEDRAQLLNASLWPDSVSVSEWFFKNPATSVR